MRITRNIITLILDTSGRAFFISNNKTKFFDQGGLAEVNRCEAALYTAVLYDQPRCLQVLVSIMGQWEPNKHNFFVKNENQSENVSASELAEAMGMLLDANFPFIWRMKYSDKCVTALYAYT